MSETARHIHYPRTWLRRTASLNEDIHQLLQDLRRNVGQGLHLGSGGVKLPGLINCDLYNPAAELKVDATDLRMFMDGSIDHIESHHMIEHLTFAEAEEAFTEWGRVLRPGGTLVLTCPDLTRICIRWLKYTLGYPVKPRPERLEYTIRMLVGSQDDDGMYHKSAYDHRRLRRLLSGHGFEMKFHYSPYPMRPTPSLLFIARKRS